VGGVILLVIFYHLSGPKSPFLCGKSYDGERMRVTRTVVCWRVKNGLRSVAHGPPFARFAQPSPRPILLISTLC
jgi:hypothetical protein